MSSERTAFNKLLTRRVKTNREAPDDEKKATSVIKQYALHYQVAAHTHHRSITEKFIRQSFYLPQKSESVQKGGGLGGGEGENYLLHISPLQTLAGFLLIFLLQSQLLAMVK